MPKKIKNFLLRHRCYIFLIVLHKTNLYWILKTDEICQINVEWDIDDNKPVEFSIIELEDVKTILELYCKNDAFVYSKKV